MRARGADLVVRALEDGGISRTSDTVGVVNVVPGAGVTHCLSGVAEAFMDTVPLVVLACGIRSDTGRAFQLHDIDQLALLRPVTKAVLRPAQDVLHAGRRRHDAAAVALGDRLRMLARAAGRHVAGAFAARPRER